MTLIGYKKAAPVDDADVKDVRHARDGHVKDKTVRCERLLYPSSSSR